MIAVTDPGLIVAWLEHLETTAVEPNVPFNLDKLKDTFNEVVGLIQDNRYTQALSLLDGSPYPQPFAYMAEKAGEDAGNNEWYLLGLVLWMRGIVYLQVEQSVRSYDDWQLVRAILEKLIIINQRRLQMGDDYDDASHPERTQWHENITWYQARLNDLRVDLACNVEEVYSWIHGLKGEEPILRPHILQMWNIINEKIKNNDWQMVNVYLEEMVDFSEAGSDYLENPEVLVLCGQALYQIHKYPLAASYMRRAVAEFHPRSHKQAASRWMLGTVQWCVKWEQRAAIENLERSIAEFEQLKSEAAQKDQKDTRDRRGVKPGMRNGWKQCDWFWQTAYTRDTHKDSRRKGGSRVSTDISTFWFKAVELETP